MKNKAVNKYYLRNMFKNVYRSILEIRRFILIKAAS